MKPKRDNRAMRARARAAVVGAVLVSLAIAGCGSPGGGTTTGQPSKLDVYNWGSADEAKVYDAAFARFSKAHDNVTVNNSVVPVEMWGDYVAKLAIQISNGQSPDLLNMALEGTQLSQSKGLLEPLDDYVAKGDLDAVLGKIPKTLLDGYTVDGKLYQIPNGAQTMAIYVNTDIFAAKGVPIPDEDWTWEDFRSVAKQLTGSDVMGFGLPWGFFQIQPWLYSNDTSFVAADGSPQLTDPAVVESVSFIADLIQTEKVAPDPTSVDVYSQFAAGKFAMIGAGRWPIPGWKEAGFTSYKALPWPKMKSHTTVFGGAGWAISADSKNKDLAWQAIGELLGEQTIKDITDIGQQIPVFPEVGTDTGDKAADDALKFLITQIDNARPVPAPPYYDTLESVTMRHMVEIATGKATPAEGLAAAQAEIEEAIK